MLRRISDAFNTHIISFGEFPRLPIRILYRSESFRGFQYAYYIVRRIPEAFNMHIITFGKFPRLSIRILDVTENFRSSQYAYCMSRRVSEAFATLSEWYLKPQNTL